MKLNGNYDYLYLKSRMQSKYDDKDYLPTAIKDSIKAILKICEDQEKELEKQQKYIIDEINEDMKKDTENSFKRVIKIIIGGE